MIILLCGGTTLDNNPIVCNSVFVVPILYKELKLHTETGSTKRTTQQDFSIISQGHIAIFFLVFKIPAHHYYGVSLLALSLTLSNTKLLDTFNAK